MVIQLIELIIGTDEFVELTGNKVSGFEIFLARHNLMIEKNNIIWNSY